MFDGVSVIGRGRVGSAAAARLAAAGVPVVEDGALRLLCVPDGAIAGAAAAIAPGPWVAHVSGATELHALTTHVHRFSVHPLQTFTRSGDPAQFEGAWAAVSGEDDAALARARWLAERLGLRPFELDDGRRALYTPVPRSPPTTWSRCTAPPRGCWTRPVRRRRRSCR